MIESYPEKLFSVADLARAVDVSAVTIYRWIYDGRKGHKLLAYATASGRVAIMLRDIEKFFFAIDNKKCAAMLAEHERKCCDDEA